MFGSTGWLVLRSVALIVGAFALMTGTALAQKGSKPSQKEISRELRELYESDQKDQNDPSWTENNDEEFSRRQGVRRERVLEILATGMLADLEDWSCAAMLLQHGGSADHYLLAHILSVPGGIEDRGTGRFMSAATLDRFLQSIGRAQIFTTQSGAADPNVYAPMEPFDDSMGQALRALFSLPPLKGPKPEEAKGKAPGAKDLAKLLELSRKAPVDASSPPEWLHQARAIAAGGTLKSEKEFALAARVLSASPAPDDLLWAHVMTLCAAFKARNETARAVCAESLDRWLVALGRPQCFDTVQEDGKPKEPNTPDAEFIRREYGLSR